MERIENIGFGELKLIQDPDAFCYGIDAVILSDFACLFYPQARNAVDLCTGTGIVPFIMSHKNKDAVFTGIDVLETSIDMAKRSCSMNGLQERVSFIQSDVLELDTAMFDGGIDMVTCNPPYFAKGGAIPSRNAEKFVARHETTATVEDFIKTAAKLLNGKGHFFMVHRPSRLVDIFFFCRKYGLEPKHIRFVVPKKGEIPNIVLIHCSAGGGRELRYLKELCVYDDNGCYTDEIEQIYERKTEECQL